MKMLFAALAVSLVFAVDGPAQSTDNLSTSRPKKAPAVGMTREKVKSYYGAPFTRTVLPDGEHWSYRLKFNEVYGRAWMSFYFDSDDVRWGSIDFGPDGRVRSFNWHPSTLRD